MADEVTVKIKLLAAVCLGGGVDGDAGETHVVSADIARDLIGAGQAEEANGDANGDSESKPANGRRKKA
jgi:hypothetical protein